MTVAVKVIRHLKGLEGQRQNPLPRRLQILLLVNPQGLESLNHTAACHQPSRYPRQFFLMLFLAQLPGPLQLTANFNTININRPPQFPQGPVVLNEVAFWFNFNILTEFYFLFLDPFLNKTKTHNFTE